MVLKQTFYKPFSRVLFCIKSIFFLSIKEVCNLSWWQRNLFSQKIMFCKTLPFTNCFPSVLLFISYSRYLCFLRRSTASEILTKSAYICKQRLSHGKEIEQSFPNWKCYYIEQEHFRKNLSNSTKFINKESP